MEPTPTPPERAEAHQRPARGRARYAWHLIQLDQWQEWLNVSDEVDDATAQLNSGRLRAAAHGYARTHGLTVESRTTRGGRTIDLRFTRGVAS